MPLRTFDIRARPQLALDHDLWESMSGAREVLHPVIKQPTPVLTPSTPWEAPGRGALWGPLHAERTTETGRVKLWYQSFDLYPGRGSNMGTRCQSIAAGRGLQSRFTIPNGTFSSFGVRPVTASWTDQSPWQRSARI